MSGVSFRLPPNTSPVDKLTHLLTYQFPAIMDESVELFSVLPETSNYGRFGSNIVEFGQALRTSTGRQLTISGIGSMLDLYEYGHTYTRPNPHNPGCDNTSLCLQPKCFGMTEGVIESNNYIKSICWDLSLDCLKDYYYSDMRFEENMAAKFHMHFQQPSGVMEAIQRTELIKEAVKVVATNQNIKITGPVVGGKDGIKIPFYMDPVDSKCMPCLENIPGGIGGFNLKAFCKYLAPRIFSNSFEGGMESVSCYGLKEDFHTAKEQTGSVMDNLSSEVLQAIMNMNDNSVDRYFGNKTYDGLFPTFCEDEMGCLELTTAETLEAATLAGFIQTDNPQHMMNNIRALLFVPANWKFKMVEPPIDDFSSILGLGKGLDFLNHTPGVHKIMSTSQFKNKTLGRHKYITLGNHMDSKGASIPSHAGLKRRSSPMKEAIRTTLQQTYSSGGCPTKDGQITRTGKASCAQHPADGFELKSQMYYQTDVKGNAKPALVFFRTDDIRPAKPITIDCYEEVEFVPEPRIRVTSCCPGGKPMAFIRLNCPVIDSGIVDGEVHVYRSGKMGCTYLVTATIDPADPECVIVEAVDATGKFDPTVQIDCCEGGANDDYGHMGTIVPNTGSALTESEILGIEYDEASATLVIELLDPIAATAPGKAATITLRNGTVLNVVTTDPAEGVFIVVESADGVVDLAEIDCNCADEAIFACV